jgi:hypothetical protein
MHAQKGMGPPSTFVEVNFFVRLSSNPPVLARLYADLPELEVHFWEYAQYQSAQQLLGFSLVQAEEIAGAAARCTMELDGRKVWITTGMSKASFFLSTVT